jgi:3-phenylpropionate/trans-cinnamate dioxygenase ferredoxin reductase subunit
MSRETIVILGAGQAGGRMAEAIRAQGIDARVILLGEEAEPPYERPPLSKEVLAGTAAEESTFLGKGAAHWSALDVELLPGTRAAALDRAARAVTVEGAAAPIRYDRLVFATGSRARRLPTLEARAAIPVLALRTLADARALRATLGPGRTLLLVGGGVIGLEVAASAVTLGTRAVLAEATPRILARCAPDVFGQRLLDLHRDKGVEIRLGTTVASLEGSVATLSDGTRIEADAVLVGIGAIANDELAAAAGLDCADGILVDAHGRTADPAVTAVGEVARHPLPRFGITLRQESWRHAEQHPRAVAAALKDPAAPGYDEVPGFWSDQHGERLLIEGLPGRATREIIRDGAKPVGFYVDDHGALIGAATLGDSRAMAVARRMIAAGARPDPAKLADPTIDLRQLLR